MVGNLKDRFFRVAANMSEAALTFQKLPNMLKLNLTHKMSKTAAADYKFCDSIIFLKIKKDMSFLIFRKIMLDILWDEKKL